MSDRPSDRDATGEQSCSAEVQDYLDMLLSPALPDSAEAVDSNGGRENIAGSLQHAELGVDRPAIFAKSPPALTMVGGTAVSTVVLHPQLRKPPRSEPVKPFAEPPRPLALKLPATETAPVVDTQPPPSVSPPPQHREEPAPVAPSQIERRVKAPLAERGSVDSEPVVGVFEPSATDIETSEIQPPTTLESEAESTAKTTEWLTNGRPSWAQQRFECLLFTVGGLTLAVPLVELGAIYPINEELTPIFGQVDWFMGLLPIRNRNIKTVNTAKVVMPERYTDAMKDKFAYVITINDVDWGLAVDKVATAITLDPEAVRWRGERSKRPWLAGTVVDHMCALLDVSQLAAMFIQQNRPRNRR